MKSIKFTVYELFLMGIVFEDDDKAIAFLKGLNDELNANIEKLIVQNMKISSIFEYKHEMTEKEQQKWMVKYAEDIRIWEENEKYKIKLRVWKDRNVMDDILHNKMLDDFAECLADIGYPSYYKLRKAGVITFGDFLGADTTKIERFSEEEIVETNERILSICNHRLELLHQDYYEERERRIKESRLEAERRENFITERIAGISLPDYMWDMTVEEMDLSVRTYNCLKRAGKNTLEDLVIMTLDDYYKVRNFGKKSLGEIRKKLSEFGVILEDDCDNAFENEPIN